MAGGKSARAWAGQHTILQGDVTEVCGGLPDEYFDGCLCDPPYGLSFMGKKWDYDVPSVEAWAAVLGALKPGAHLLAFAGTRTQHRMAVRIEDAGFEIRDMIAWVYGSGFPKSLDVSKAIDKAAGMEREVVGPPPYTRGKASQSYSETRRVSYDYDPQPITAPATDAARQWSGYGTALKPALEPITVARKPFKGTVANNCLEYGTGAINIDAGRVGSNPGYKYRADANGTTFHGQQGERIKQTAKKKGAEFIESTKGRWPANLIHDGSEEVLAGFPESKGQQGDVKGTEPSKPTAEIFGQFAGRVASPARNDSGSSARFFYCAKVNPKERDGLKHPTMKPLALAEYLARLILPPKLSAPRRLLVPFCGVGSEIIGALRAGWDEVWGIEMSQEYVDLAESRIVRLASKTGVK